MVALAGLQDHGREFGLIRGIGKVLGFQAEGVAARIGCAAFAGSFAVEKIAGVKLDAGLGGPNFEDAAEGGVDDARGDGRGRIEIRPRRAFSAGDRNGSRG